MGLWTALFCSLHETIFTGLGQDKELQPDFGDSSTFSQIYPAKLNKL